MEQSVNVVTVTSPGPVLTPITAYTCLLTTAAILISIEANPNSFALFNTSSTGVQLPFAVPFFTASGEGQACIPVDIGSLNIPGVQDGSNVTLQVQFNGGDGNLFQVRNVFRF